MSDVFGKAVLAHLNGHHKAEIKVKINDEKDDSIPTSTLFRSYEEMPDLEQIALSLAEGKILDLGAAAGCHSLYLKSKGYNVYSLEKSEGCCEAMMLQGLDKIIHQDLFELDLKEKFRTIYLLMNGIGMCGTLDNFGGFLKIMDRLLEPGGSIIADSSDLIYLYQNDDGSVSIPIHKYYGEIDFEISFDDQRETFKWVYIDPEQLESLCDDHGWLVEFLGDDDRFHYLFRLQRKTDQGLA